MKKWGWVLLIFLLVFGFFTYHSLTSDQYSLDGLYPPVKKAVGQLEENCIKRGITIQITEGFRSFEKQNQLYEQGRTMSGPIITNAKGGQSYHNYGLAIDFALINPKNKQLSWNTKIDRNHNGTADWMEVVQEAKKLGFAWGGDWENFKDYPHLEMNFGQSIGELQSKMWLHGK
jgi:peptidoglycan L-alanyl-D-glutamate endopeptidase CwlK